MKRHLVVLTYLILILINIKPAESKFIKRGQVGFRFLENPVSAEAIGRGGLGIVTIQNANAVFWNPSGIGWIDGRFDFCANYTRSIADINYSSLAGAVNLGNYGIIALDYLGMDYGDFTGTRRANNAQGFEYTGTFSPNAYSFGLTYSQKVSDRFSYGVRGKYAVQNLGSVWVGLEGSDVDDTSLVMGKKSYSLSEPAIDIGATYDFLSHGLRFGAVMQNFSRELRYEREKFPMPFSVSFSLSAKPLLFVTSDKIANDLTIGFETCHPRDFKEKIKFGAEYFYDNILIVRTGYMGNYDERGLTLGLGVRKSYLNMNLRIDYSFQDFGVFNSVHTFSFGVSQ